MVNFTFLILSDENEHKGFVFFEIADKASTPFKKPYKSLYVHQLSVEKSDQKKGYGHALMNKIAEIAKKNNADCIELDYWTDNEIAKKFYRKRGFHLEREFVRKNL